MNSALTLACCLLCLATILPFLSTGAWLVRLCDFPRIQLMIVAVTIMLLVAVVHRSNLSKASVLLVLCATAACFVWQASHVWTYTPMVRKELPDAVGKDGEPIRLAVINLQFENPRKAELVSQLESLDVDIVLLIEVDQAWDESLQPVYARFPYKFGVVREEGLGLQLLSQYPFITKEVRHLVDQNRPSLWCSVRVASQIIHYIGLHPTPPGLPVDRESGPQISGPRHNSRIRDAELMLVAKEVAKEPARHWVVAGDFNDVAWSHTTRLFKRLSGLADPRVGRGLYNSYHATYPFLRFPIDQVWFSPDARVSRMGRFRPVGSDHFAILTDVVFEKTGDDATPKPEGDDKKDAKQMIDEGVEDATQAEQKSDR